MLVLTLTIQERASLMDDQITAGTLVCAIQKITDNHGDAALCRHTRRVLI